MSAGAPVVRARGLPGDSLELALRFALLVLVLDPPLHWFQRVPIWAVASAGLLLPGLMRRPGLWLCLCGLTTWPLLWGWPFSDNHDYLRALLCLGVATSLPAPDPRRALAWNARWLIGLTFAFAALWKGLLSPDYLDGSFFRVTLLSDGRFHDLAVLLGGVTEASLSAFDAGLHAFLSADSASAPVSSPWAPGFVEPAALRRLAALLTAFTLLGEAAIALAFLWPPAGRLRRWRNGLLLGFGVASYSFATVRGFGWLLMALGAAQCENRERRTPLLYVGVFVLIEVYRSVPWSHALVTLLAPG